jgi:predicted metallo-beta-lactamase superfamily hydrolase
MKLGEIEVEPLAAESLGIRSLCTRVTTPDVSLVLDPSAALAKRYNLEPHPQEYRALMNAMNRIRKEAKQSQVLSISHYHFDHVRPGFKNCLYNLSTRSERRAMFSGKHLLAKDNRDNINPSQRRRAYYFLKDVEPVIEKIQWSDGKTFEFGGTTLTYSPPLPHGETDSRLGFVVTTLVEYEGARFLFAPDVQGPIDRESLRYFLSLKPDLAIVGGPPTYLHKFTERSEQAALYSLVQLASTVKTLVVDHHNMRDIGWKSWIQPIIAAAERAGNSVETMASLKGEPVGPLESKREELYDSDPPSEDFIHWCDASLEYKTDNLPPV